MKKLIALMVGLVLVGGVLLSGLGFLVVADLPKMISVEDYKPLLVSEVFDRSGKKVGEFFREKRMLLPHDQLPQKVVQAFIAAEDSSFFEHGGLNFLAIARAMWANLRAGRKAQGGSTITQQVARSLLLSSEKTYIRKIKEALLAIKMEKNLSKGDIIYLYLNQIYLGQGAYGVGAASLVYFRKPVQELSVPEMALLAGLPQAPSRYSPITNPQRAKERQLYVLNRMAEEKFISPEEAKVYSAEPVKVYVWKNYREIAPFYNETIRQILVQKLGEEMVLDKGIKVYTALDVDKQLAAQEQIQVGLRELDKRQGYRGPLKHLEDPKIVAEFLLKTRNELMDDFSQERILRPDGSFEERKPLNLTGLDEKGQPLPNLPKYLKPGQYAKAVVTKTDDRWGLVYVRFAESKGLIDLDTMKWARKPDPSVRWDASPIKKPSDALKSGDIIQVKIVGSSFRSSRLAEDIREWRKKNKEKPPARPDDLPEFNDYAEVELEQEPIAEGALVSIDEQTGELIAMVGGYDFARSQFNRAIQALRQTGSSFKSLVYTAALDRNYTPATPVLDAPLVYEEADPEAAAKLPAKSAGEEGQDIDALATKKWKPANHSKSFAGEILFRNALIRSLNVPTVKIIEDIGVDWVMQYARRLGIFSPLNPDFTLALGSSGVTVYEMTKAFAIIGRLGQNVRPILIHKVVDPSGAVLLENLSLDDRFENELSKIRENFEARRKAYLSATKSLPPVSGAATGDDGSVQNPANPEAKKLVSKEPPIFFEDPEQLIRPQTAFVTTSLLQSAVEEKGGTGGAARALGRPVAGKTGTTSGYYDAWFIGFTPDIATGVWVGFDEEKSLGRGEVGGRAALPIWLEYMRRAHEDLPARGFSVPQGIVFANIDNQTGKLASAASQDVVRQAFLEGSEPQVISGESNKEQEQQFYKEDLSE